MARHKDQEWALADDINQSGNVAGLTRRAVAVLMDIRSELQQLNGLLRCPNFLSMPGELRAIRRNTATRRRRKAKR